MNPLRGDERQTRANRRASPRGRLDLQLTSDEYDTFLHAQEPVTRSGRRAPARGGDLEPLAVVAHDQLQSIVCLAQFNVDDPRLRVTNDVGERLLRDAEAPHFPADRHP